MLQNNKITLQKCQVHRQRGKTKQPSQIGGNQEIKGNSGKTGEI